MLGHLILSPNRGWEDVMHYNLGQYRVLKSGLYPLFIVAALSVFIIGIYDSSLTFVSLFQRSIITFVQFFISYYIAQTIFSLTIEKYVENGSIDDNRVGLFISIGLGLLAIIEVIKNVLPVELSLVQFLPIYVAIILWKGAAFLHVVDSKINYFVFLTIIAIIVPVYLLGLLNLLIN
jgi:heme/copper-type cytochrome/quinol oxidase subunit 4